jgi:hypothetical protein
MTNEPVRVTITHSDSPYCGQKAAVRRVKYAAHVDLLVELAGGMKITVDSTWTDYWERKGERPPPTSLMASSEQARRLHELLNGLERRVNKAEEGDGASSVNGETLDGESKTSESNETPGGITTGSVKGGVTQLE